jgi:hypothetical protein
MAALLLLAQTGLAATARADTGEIPSYETLAIPFPFYNESFGFAAGYVYGRAGWPEPQARVLATAMAGTRGTAALLIAGQDLRTPWLDRLFIDPSPRSAISARSRASSTAIRIFRTRTPGATTPMRRTSSAARVSTTSFESASITCYRSATAGSRSCRATT